MFSALGRSLFTTHSKAYLIQPILKKSIYTTSENFATKVKELEQAKKNAEKQRFQDGIASSLFLGTGLAGMAGGVKAAISIAHLGPSLPTNCLSLSVLTVSVVASIHFGGGVSSRFLKDAVSAHNKSKEIGLEISNLTRKPENVTKTGSIT